MVKYTLSISGKDLPDLDWLSKSDPYVCILLVTKCGSLKFLNKTEIKMNDLNPSWEDIDIEIPDEDLNGDDVDSTLLCFEVCTN